VSRRLATEVSLVRQTCHVAPQLTAFFFCSVQSEEDLRNCTGAKPYSRPVNRDYAWFRRSLDSQCPACRRAIKLLNTPLSSDAIHDSIHQRRFAA
jgi:hypothetical protein